MFMCYILKCSIWCATKFYFVETITVRIYLKYISLKEGSGSFKTSLTAWVVLSLKEAIVALC